MIKNLGGGNKHVNFFIKPLSFFSNEKCLNIGMQFWDLPQKVTLNEQKLINFSTLSTIRINFQKAYLKYTHIVHFA